MFFRRRLGAFDASASLGSLGVSFFFSAIFPFFFSFSEISLPSWGFFPLSGVFISSPFYFVLLRNCLFLSFRNFFLWVYRFFTFFLLFIPLRLRIWNGKTEKRFRWVEQFPFHYFSPARAELVSFPTRKPLPITDRRIYFPLTCCCSGQTTNEHAFTFSFRKKNVALFFLFSNSRKKKVGALRELRTVWPRCHSNGGFLFLSRIRSWRHFVRRALSYNNYMLPHLHIAGHMFRASLAFLSTRLSPAKSLNIFQY